MNHESCDRIAHLASGWALGALDADEAAALRDHLESCGRDHPELRDALALASALAEALPAPDAPSPALRSRLLDAARAEHEEVARPRPDRSDQVVVPWRGIAAGAGALALAASLALAVFVGETGALRDRIGQLESQLTTVTADLASARSWIDRAVARGATAYFMDGEGGAQQASFMLVVEPEATGAMLLMSGLPALEPGETYELWVERDGSIIGVGTFQPDESGLAAVAIDDSLEGIRQAMITVEPDGGSAQPSDGEVIMQGELGI